ncbi:HK97 family phage prohead protease [Streptomyces sp. BK022]|uniref:NUDIX domain-containing protein n=1 Tax=Streptomyces sp. BK022 TaxID=2512123 RepID=UPI001028E29B|nr:NUDIX domain-containing protein [Streptomyces sp. BK022]RZU28321.1 HK97 family phage prohead protease [Streptomyces sp. BK022]
MPSAPPTPASLPASLRGVGRAIYAVTGVVDEVNDLILPGAFTKTLSTRPVKTVWHHEWKEPCGVVLSVEEWLPGDKRFAEIPDWPAQAGALVATVSYNLRTSKGRDTYEQVKQWHERGEAAFSIGYRVPETAATKRADGVRVIHSLDLFEVSPVLHGAHPMTRSLEIKSAAGTAPDMEYKATATAITLAAPESSDDIKVAGLTVKAADTSRILLIQRALDPEDPAAGTWEFPGGHLEDGENPLAAALREWQEETGSELPADASVVGSWTAPNGKYRGFVVVVPSEQSVPINRPAAERPLANPDDPKGDSPEVTAWWPLHALPDMPLLRPACRDTPWALLTGASLPQNPASGKPSPAAQQFAAAVMAAYTSPAAGGEQKAHADVAAARATPARIEHKSAHTAVAEAKSLPTPPTEAPAMSTYLPESMEAFQSRLRGLVRDLFREGNDAAWPCIEGTYPNQVIVTVHYDDGSSEDGNAYAVPYTVDADGGITLDTPQPVELATVVIPQGDGAQREATDTEDIDARVVQPAVEALTDATARVSNSGADAGQLEDVRASVRELIEALSAKGLDVAAAKVERPAAAPSGNALDLWDADAFPEDEEDEEELPNPDPDEDDGGDEDDEDAEETVRIDPAEMKALMEAFELSRTLIPS